MTSTLEPIAPPTVPLTVEQLRGIAGSVPDPEIPVISIVDLGVVAGVRVDGERVEVDFTPTFMGCPALDTMRRQMEDAVRGLGAEPVVHVGVDGFEQGAERLASALVRRYSPPIGLVDLDALPGARGVRGGHGDPQPPPLYERPLPGDPHTDRRRAAVGG